MAELIEDPFPKHLTGAIGTAFVLLVNVLMVQKGGLGPIDDYPIDAGPHLDENKDVQFDFIIVGAGAAGCVLANRLSEHEEWKVLLLEAGDYPSSSSEVPAFYHTLLQTSEDWRFMTNESEHYCQGMVENKCHLPKGKVVGGTGTINNLHYNRGNSKDFDDWSDMGNTAWEWDTVSTFYDRIENFHGTNSYPIHYSTSGALHLATFDYESSFKTMIYDGAQRLAQSKLKHGEHLGYVDTAATLHGGTRHNMAKAFLKPIRSRENFFFAKNCLVTKLIIPDAKERRVKGVEAILNANETIKLRAKREVILCAGAINTPKIMLLSGLGPRDHLKSLGITVLSDLQVGENLQEHFGVPIFVGLDKNKIEPTDQVYQLMDNTYNYMLYRNGSLTHTNLNGLVGYLNVRKEPYEYPNLAIYHHHFLANDITFPGFLDRIGYQPEITKSLLVHNQNQTILVFIPTVLRPKSRGRVVLDEPTPMVPPVIVPNFLTDQNEEDLQILITGFKYILRLVETQPFRTHEAEVLYVDIPNCRNFAFCNEPFIKCHVQNLGYPMGNVAGTTKMGALCEKDSVVQENLLVKSVKGLRVVDASAMPEIVSGNVGGTVAMMAEKISECIKVKWIKDHPPGPTCKCKKDG